eukprot:scaffold5665_cov92-Skeletonema_dohrnii-CCMP3373.AAC.4
MSLMVVVGNLQGGIGGGITNARIDGKMMEEGEREREYCSCAGCWLAGTTIYHSGTLPACYPKRRLAAHGVHTTIVFEIRLTMNSCKSGGGLVRVTSSSFLAIAMPESRLQKLRKESERYSIDIKEKEADNNVFRKQIREIKATIHQTQREYHATAKGTSKAENQRIKMQKLLKRQKLANEVNAQKKEIAELRLELKRLSKKTFPQFDDTL